MWLIVHFKIGYMMKIITIYGITLTQKHFSKHAFFEQQQQQNSKIVANSLFDHYLFIFSHILLHMRCLFEIFALCLLCTVFFLLSQGIVDNNGMIWLTIKPIKTCISNELCVCTDHSHTKIITTKLHTLLTNTFMHTAPHYIFLLLLYCLHWFYIGGWCSFAHMLVPDASGPMQCQTNEK